MIGTTSSLRYRTARLARLGAAAALVGILASASASAPPQRSTQRRPDPPRITNSESDDIAIDAERVRALRVGDEFALPGPDGRSRRMRVDSVGETESGARTLTFVGAGELGTSPFTNATLVAIGDRVAGFLRTDDGLVTTLIPMAGGRQRIEVRPGEEFECGGAVGGAFVGKPANGAGGIAADCGDPATMADVLVVYTVESVAAIGDATALEALITAAITDGNTSLKNSFLNHRFRLVAMVEVAFPESGDIGFDLSNLIDPNDGVGDEIHAMRDAYGADLVQLITTSGGACGIAALFDDDAANAFSAVNVTCLGGFTSAHELGHNYGCCHAVGDGGGCDAGGYFPFSNGYRFTGMSGMLWRTVMAYAPGTRIPYFSNPNRIFDGQPTGVAGSTMAAADNARTIGNTMSSVSNFRCATEGAPDCNNNGIPDSIDLLDGTSEDCNENGVPDECDIAQGFSADANNDGVPDECPLVDAKFLPFETPGDPRILDVFGFSIGVGRFTVDTEPYAVFGAFGDDEGATDAGAAFVFKRSVGGVWSQTAKLLASDPMPGANFGRNVSAWKRPSQTTPAAPERRFIAVGAYRADDGSVDEKGAVYIFAQNPGDPITSWPQTLKLKASDGGANHWFGFSTAMTRVGADAGDTIVVGAPRSNAGKGAVYVYRYNANNTTTLRKKLLMPVAVDGADFGWSVAIDRLVTVTTGNPPAPVDRSVLIAGSPGFGNDVGRVRAYERTLASNGNFPSSGQTLAAPAAEAGEGDRFGEAIAIQDNLVAVGAPGQNGGAGSVYLFERTAPNVWAVQQKIVAPVAGTDDRFGSSVAFYSDGVDLFLAVGAPRTDVQTSSGTKTDAGAVWIFKLGAASPPFFDPYLSVSAYDAQTGDQFGAALAPDGDKLFSGSPFDDDSGLNSGSAYLLQNLVP